jgi:hypothetical protein
VWSHVVELLRRDSVPHSKAGSMVFPSDSAMSESVTTCWYRRQKFIMRILAGENSPESSTMFMRNRSSCRWIAGTNGCSISIAPLIWCRKRRIGGISLPSRWGSFILKIIRDGCARMGSRTPADSNKLRPSIRWSIWEHNWRGNWYEDVWVHWGSVLHPEESPAPTYTVY